MRFGEAIIVYLVIGAGISIALAVRTVEKGKIRRIYLAVVGVVFWPIFLPALIAKPGQKNQQTLSANSVESNALLGRISEIEGELNRLLSNKEGWAERVLAGESDKIRLLIGVMRSQADRINEMEHLLFELNGKRTTSMNQAQIGRRDNIDFLTKLHASAEHDLWQIITKIEELIGMVYVARFAGGSRSEVDQLLTAISSTVEGISAVAEQQSC